MLSMLMALVFTILLITTNKFSWEEKIWSFCLIVAFSFLSLYSPVLDFEQVNYYMMSDLLSATLISLTLWVSLLMLVASQNSVKLNKNNVSLFIILISVLTGVLLLAFSTASIMYFYFFFEGSLIPTLFLILGWGYQPERLQAGMYMMIYTVAASLPLLLMIICISGKTDSSGIMMLSTLRLNQDFSFWVTNLFMVIVFAAFLVKLPTFMVHLWLPKAHVEAPVAGSMVLAAILLKLGGYGILRSFQYFNFFISESSTFLFVLSVWGGVLTSIICFRQTDLKSLIAYSSIGHMSLMLAGTFSTTSWGWGGATILMIAHAFCSAALFALANYTYEKTHSRSLYLTKGMLMLLPAVTLWWFLFSIINMAAPPSINLLGEIMIFVATLFSSEYCLISVALMSFLSAMYSMYLFTTSQHGGSPPHMKPFVMFSSLGYTLLLLFLIPANLLIIKSNLYFWL